jgi:hypothetical protein
MTDLADKATMLYPMTTESASDNQMTLQASLKHAQVLIRSGNLLAVERISR